MDTSELMEELLQALTNDVQALRKRVETLPVDPPTDYRVSLAGLTKAVQALTNRPQPQPTQPAPAAPDLSAITARLERIEQLSRQRPEYTLSQYVRYGGYAFGVMVVLLATSVWFALTWRSERERYAQAYRADNWRVRYTQQVVPNYYQLMEGKFAQDPTIYQWIVEQEQADQTRVLAQKAAEQAKALSDQANRLEGRTGTKGKKKDRS